MIVASSQLGFFLLTNCLFLAGLLTSNVLSPFLCWTSYFSRIVSVFLLVKRFHERTCVTGRRILQCWAPVAEATSCHALLFRDRLVSRDSPFTGELHEIKRLALFSSSRFTSCLAFYSVFSSFLLPSSFLVASGVPLLLLFHLHFSSLDHRQSEVTDEARCSPTERVSLSLEISLLQSSKGVFPTRSHLSVISTKCVIQER